MITHLACSVGQIQGNAVIIYLRMISVCRFWNELIGKLLYLNGPWLISSLDQAPN